MDFGVRLWVVRMDKQMSQAELAKASGLSVSAISALERGERKPLLETAQSLAKALNVKLGEIVGLR